MQHPSFVGHRTGKRWPARRSAAVAALAAFAFAATTHAASFTATLDRTEIMLGEAAALSLTFEDASPGGPPALPDVPGLRIEYIGPSSSFSFINGRTTSSVSFNYRVTPQRAGEFTIPALTVTVGGQALHSTPLRLRVTPPSAPPPEAVQAGAQPAFMRLVMPKPEMYLGEPVVAELQVCFRQDVQNFGNFQLTALPADGFSVGKNAAGARRRVQIGNAVYTLVPIQLALTPLKTGAQTLGPVTARVTVELATGRRRDPFFEQFGFGLFGGAEQREVTLVADAQTVRVWPLPTNNVPPGFQGAIGQFTMDVSVGPTNVAAGDPITVRVRLTGRGALDALALPEQPAWTRFKTYPPTVNVEFTDPLGLQGTKTFEQVITPQDAGLTELPAFTFSFFDPEARAYRTLTHPATPLVVRPGGTVSLPTTAAARSVSEPPAAHDLVPIKQRPGALAAASPPLLLQPWFVAAQGVPVLAFVLALVWRRRTDRLANDPRLRRQREVARAVREGLDALRQHA
ncbi:MAG: BatD family protein, partial [Verrucomicrobiales bacterium]|nr:BatD family protein [Verrucomicrobiales bacterium]